MKKIFSNFTMQYPVHYNLKPSSLLIPENMIGYFNKRLKRFGGLPNYFDYLIKQFQIQTRSEIPMGDFSDKVEYQSSDFKLKKISFRPKEGNWFEFGLIAQRWNISRCYLFVLLLKLDYGKLGQALKNKFGIGLPTIMRYFRKRFYIIKGFFPTRKHPKGIVTIIYDKKIRR